MTTTRPNFARAAIKVATAITVATAAVVVASAATLGGANTDNLFATANPEPRCAQRIDATGIGASFTTIRLDGYPGACDGLNAKATVANAAGVSLSTGTATIAPAATTMTLGGAVSTNTAARAAGVIGQLGVGVDLATQVTNWQLAESPPPPPSIVFTDDFEAFAGWNINSPGTVTASTAQARTGLQSGLKNTNNDPAGAWKSLGTTVGDFTFDAWLYRPDPYAGGANDRVSLENSSFNGYGFLVNHSANQLSIERRNSGSGTTLSTITFNPPENEWIRLSLTRAGTNLSATAYNTAGTPISSTVTATDSNFTTFDRTVIRGGWPYYVDDITVSGAASAPTTIAVDAAGTLDGTYVGTPTLGAPGLVPASGNTAVSFDGTDDAVLIGDSPFLNTTTRPTRTVELWFSADTVGGKRILYEEGGSTNGISIYLDGTTLWTSAWSQTQSWSNQLSVAAPTPVTTATTYFVTAVLDATTTRSLTLYVNGSPVGTATKTDFNPWNTHTDDGAIATLNATSRLHDGPISGTGFFFDGTIQNVSAFNTANTAARITNTWLAAQ